VNNTMFLPEKWAVRILQESTDARFAPCGDNAFVNNLVVLDSRAAAPTFNIGPNTAPQTFLFSNNLWFNVDNASWGGPNAPTPDMNAIVGRDPRLRAPAMTDGDFTPLAGSPAIGAGTPAAMPAEDHYGRVFNNPPSIGAVEGNPPVSAAGAPASPAALEATLFPQPSYGSVHLRLGGFRHGSLAIVLYDAAGRKLQEWTHEHVADATPFQLDFAATVRRSGWYVLGISDGTRRMLRPLLHMR
jgi:hypothetical protein